MALYRPGNFDITDSMMERAALAKGSRVLDIGCGDGDTVVHLTDEWGMKAEGIDISLSKINEAKEKHPGINVKFGDGEFLDSYTSFSFDAIMMECSLSLINLPDEALHEAYCVLKKGGRLMISDLYHKNPAPKQMRAVAKEAQRQSRLPHKEGDCEEDKERLVEFRYEGAFYKEPLIKYLKEIGYRIRVFEDRSDDLDAFVAQYVMDGGKPEDLMGGRKPKDAKNLGYFLLVADKPI